MINQLRVYRHTNKGSITENVSTTQEAIDFINKWTKIDLKDDSIEWNAFGLEEYDETANDLDCNWFEWYNEEGEDILEVMDATSQEG